MAAIWKGSINFGLVHIPVSVQSATGGDSISFRQLDGRDMSPIRYRRVNENTGKEVDWGEIVKGYEYEKDKFVIMTDEDFEKARIESNQSVDIQYFVEDGDISPVFFETPYFLVPQKGGQKGYLLLREALQRTGRIAVAKVVLRTKEYLAAIYPRENVLVMNTLRYDHEIRSTKDIAIEAEINKKEIDMAERLVEELAGDWKPEEFGDRYAEALQRIIEDKVAGRAHKVKKSSRAEPTGAVVDLVELLQRSIKGAGSRGGPRKTKPPTKKKTQRKAA